ncbi:hypothetical protein GDO78_001069 [Eleutherodactylus coqui]|uniref:Protein broad-minded n=1 Tax=Eleutherodactylus coqui TaxID=57060 RepID=A0A8J6FRQ3_ELECQ|nr:hypothetical protein GDO78_001069 [Eleutherodactylus coqui]
MASFSAEDEISLQSMVRQLLQSVKEKLSSAPSAECAEEVLLHLEETDEHFHNYELVKYLRHYIKSSLGSVIDDETERCSFAQSQVEGSGYDTLVQRVTKRTRESKDYTFMNQEQLQLIAEQLDPSQPEEVRKEAMQTLCSAPPSDVLNCECWSVLHKNLTAALADPDSTFTERILRFFAKTFSSSPLNMAREVYTSLAKHLESSFVSSHKPILLTGVDINNPEVVRMLKKIRLLNDYQKEVPSFWIRHPEKYMEEIIESTLSLLSVTQESSSQMLLDPVFYLSMVDTKAVWFKKWMHAYYSRTVVLRLLEKRYKSLIIAAIEQCFSYYESSQSGADENTKTASSLPYPGIKQKTFYSRKELQYLYFVHSLNVLGRLLIYKHGRKLFPIKLKNRKESVSLCDLVVLFTHIMLYCRNGQKRTLGAYAGNDYKIMVHQNCDECTLTFLADILARIASSEAGISLFLYGEKTDSTKDSTAAAHVIAQFSKKLLSDDITILTESDLLPVVKGSFLFVCRQMYHTCEGLQVLAPYQLHVCIAGAWRKESLLDSLLNFASTPRGLLLLQQTGVINECIHFMFSRFTKTLQVNRSEKFGYDALVTQVAATAPGAVALQKSGFIQAFVSELWAALECARDDVRVIHPKPTPVDPIDRSCQKSFLALVNLLSSFHAVYELLGKQHLPSKNEYSLREVPTSFVDVFDRLVIVNSVAKMNSLFNYDQSHIFGLRLLNVLCCNLDTLLLLESQYKVCEMLFNAQGENITDSSTGSQNIIIDGLSVERNHILVRMNVIGGPCERFLPPRVMLQTNDPYPWPMFSSYPLPKCYIPEVTGTADPKQDHELLRFLSFGGTDQKVTWLDNCKRIFCNTIKTKPGVLRGSVYGELLEKFITHTYDIPSNCVFERSEYKERSIGAALVKSWRRACKVRIRGTSSLPVLAERSARDG